MFWPLRGWSGACASALRRSCATPQAGAGSRAPCEGNLSKRHASRPTGTKISHFCFWKDHYLVNKFTLGPISKIWFYCSLILASFFCRILAPSLLSKGLQYGFFSAPFPKDLVAIKQAGNPMVSHYFAQNVQTKGRMRGGAQPALSLEHAIIL